jgi:uncharacterized protein YjbI with pentapeptide repeats
MTQRYCFLRLVVVTVVVIGSTSPAQADIFQWEYIDPADPSQGKQQSTKLAPDGAGVDAMPGAQLSYRDLTMAYLDGANLSSAALGVSSLRNASMVGANLTDATISGELVAFIVPIESEFVVQPRVYADLSDADLTNANLQRTSFYGSRLTDAILDGANIRQAHFSKGDWFWHTGTGITLPQLYSTASYQARDLAGVYFNFNELPGANFISQHLTSARFVGANLTGGDFTDADLTNVDFHGAKLDGANFAGTNLTGIQFRGTSLTNANFAGADVRGGRFDRTFLTYNLALFYNPFGTGLTPEQLYLTASYKAGDLSGISLSWNNLAGANFGGQNLTNANFRAADLTNADFTDANIRGAGFDNEFGLGTGLSLVQLYSTSSYQARDLSGISLRSNHLSGGNFARQNLASTTFEGAQLGGANFQGATLTGAQFAHAEVRGANFAPIIYFPPFAEGVVIGTGITLEQLYSTTSYKAHDLGGIVLLGHNLAGANFSKQSLRDANFGAAVYVAPDYGTGAATLTGASFTDADLRGARFDNTTLTATDFNGADVRGASFARYPYSEPGTGITPAQLYSTASYQARDLSGTDFGGNLLAGGQFAGQKLTNANFGNRYYAINRRTGQPEWQIYYATLTGANFTGADIRGAQYLEHLDVSGATTTNLIWPDGHIRGLDLDGGGLLIVRDYDGNANPPYPLPLIPPLSIVTDNYLEMGLGGTLRMVFEADAWDSTICFSPGIPVSLGGTLELTFAADANPATQLGRTFDLFDWTGVTPTGAFAVASSYRWDLSKLYTSGEVTLTAIPESRTLLLLAFAFTASVVMGRAPRFIHSVKGENQ